MLVDKRLIVRGERDAQAEFRELAEMYRERVRTHNYSYLWFRGIFPRWGRQSPKMCCWVARECFDEMYRHFQEDDVASGRGNKPEAKDNEPAWGFVNVQLSDEERTAAVLDYADNDTLWDTLVVSIKDGYKVTLSYDGETNSYCAALSGTNCGKPNERLTLTAWGSDEIMALQYLIYKHVTKLEFVWQKPGAKQARLG